MSRPHPYHLSHRVAAAKAAEYMAKALDMEANATSIWLNSKS